MQVSIILSTYPLGLEQTIKALNENDEDVLDMEIIQKLNDIKKNIADSMDSIKSFTGDISEVHKTEQFVISMVRIPLFGNLVVNLIYRC